MESARFIRHAPCDACGSSDANSVYDDGHTYCFKCQAYTTAGTEAQPTTRRSRLPADVIVDGLEYLPLEKRKITQETCRHFGYQCGTFAGKPVQVAPYYDAEGQLVGQKVRFPGKEFTILGSLKKALPFGAQAFPKTGRQIVVTEGEIDALSMSQVQGNKWPVVSVPNGAQSAKKFIAEQRDYFLGFEKVILMFDNDEEGRKATKACAQVLGDRALIAELPLKDANEMLVAGRAKELVTAMWQAKAWQPEGIVELSTLKEAVKELPAQGVSWWSPKLTELTHGIRLGEIYCFGAGTGTGKSDWFSQQIAHLVQQGLACGVFALEQAPVESAKRIAGKVAKRPLHVPEGWDEAAFDAAWDVLMRSGKVFLYDSYGINDWSSIKERIEYLVHAHGCQYIFLDHLTALAAAEEDERVALERIMGEMASLVKRLNISLFLISHLATPDKGSHEEGARVTIRQLKGSRAIGFWCNFIVGLERDQQSDDEAVRTTTTVRVLKDRLTGRATGSTFDISYDFNTGLLYEKEMFAAEGSSDF